MNNEFAVFAFAGNFSSTERRVAIQSRNVEYAEGIAQQMTIECGFQPVAFRFETMSDDGSIQNRSGWFYLGGTVETLQDITGKNEPGDSRLIHFLEESGLNKIVTNNCPYLVRFPLRDQDQVLSWEPVAENGFGMR
ncbi:hypothetical protein [Rhizobium lusitanum]|uniref:Uncharacterized protein n=1 Tax=Rhizobium lusitanum TaxID=293958 RepID=A0A7X0MEH1_9HYPH|nr:hypothetical protein [Rhizobium lusitanum]MBB6487942.1 hypothetical protein [Rhizobium lusitanum]